MSSNDWEQTLDELKQEIASIKSRSGTFSTKFEEVRRQAESLKIAFLNHRLEVQRRSLARTRGYTSIMRDGKRLGASLGAAAAGLIFGGIITRDKFAALHTGISAFDGALQGLGQTRWFVSLSKKIAVAPENSLSPEGIWVTWESLNRAMKGLKDKAVVGEKLGNLDNVIFKLKREKLVYLGLPVAKPDSSKEQNFK